MKHHPIFERWPPKHPDQIQLYSINSPNGIKAATVLEETGLPYEPHTVNLFEDEQFTDEYKSLSPNSKIPAIIDPNGPNGAMLSIMESGAILIYLAEKSGTLLPSDPIAKSECLQWLFFQVGHIGPMFGQFEHFFRFAGKDLADPYTKERYRNEARRLLTVLDERLEGRDTIMGTEYTIADIAIFPWVRSIKRMCETEDYLGLHDLVHVNCWLTACIERRASRIGFTVCAENA